MSLKKIDGGNDWGIFTSDTARTAFPFVEEARADGGYNHPYCDLIVRKDKIAQIPEVVRFPFLGPILEAANSTWSLLRTTACDAAARPRDPLPKDGYTHFAGGMIVIAYRLDWHNMDREKLVQLARLLEEAMDRPNPACRVRYVIEPYKSWHGEEEPIHYNLTLEFAGVGFAPDEALAAAEMMSHSVTLAVSKVATSDTLLNMSQERMP